MDKKTPVGGWKSCFPVLDWLPHDQSEWLRFDMIAALSVYVLLGHALFSTAGQVVNGAAIAAVPGSVIILWATAGTNEWIAYTASLAVFAGLVYILRDSENPGGAKGKWKLYPGSD